MGSNQSRSLLRGSNNASNSSNQKDKHASKSKFASPENRVLPVVTNAPQKLRSTDNGYILQSGGTISGRKNNQSSESSNDSEFTRYLQKKSQAYPSSSQDVSFQTMFGHKKSHSDPDIIRKMMEENETEEDEDGRYETESNPNQRSIKALSPSKAKIRSRKKKKAPEPPQPNTLPRIVVGRNSSIREAQDLGNYNYSYDSAPRRPLPPIPLEEMPPPPPPPPPDYNRAMENREIPKLPGKSFQKNRRVFDKWRFGKPNSECFEDKRQRSKSLDRMEDTRLFENQNINGEMLVRNRSSHNLTQRAEYSKSEDETKGPSQSALNDAIIDAARKRAERLARTRMCRNLSFKSSMNQLHEDEATNTVQTASKNIERDSNGNGNTPYYPKDYGPSHINREPETHSKESGEAHNSRNFPSHSQVLRKPADNEKSESPARSQDPKGNSSREMCSKDNKDILLDGYSREHGNMHEREHRDQYTRVYREPCSSGNQPFYTGHSPNSRGHGGSNFKEYRSNPYSSNDSYTKGQQSSYDSNNRGQYKNHQRISYEKRGHKEYRESYTKEINDDHKMESITDALGDIKEQHYSYHGDNKENKADNNGNYVSHNFSRTGAMHKRTHNKKKYSHDHRPEGEEIMMKQHYNIVSRVEMGILPTFSDDQVIWSSRSQEQVIGIIPNGTISSSSISEEEMEINLQLRPTLPRRQVDIPRFSPTDVWKSINLDFFKSHQQRSDVSSEDGEDLMEEKIHRINRAVAPRRLIVDRSGDSGISPDAGSPMFLNETSDSPITAHDTHNDVSCVALNVSNEDANATWVPQQDLEDSECLSDTSLRENKPGISNGIVQPKLSMPNIMFPSRSLPRTDHKNGVEEKDVSEKDKSRSRDRRKRITKNSETQHFNSLRNLKRVLGLKPKSTTVEANGLDSNWFLSRSLPNFEDVSNVDEAKPEIEVPEVSVLDHIRRSNSESRMVQQENNRIQSSYSSHNVNQDWRRSFPGQCTEGHVMYLPEYYSTVTPLQTNMNCFTVHVQDSANVKYNIEFDENNPFGELEEKKMKNRKKFSYQSTVRQQEKRKLEEKLAKEVEENEKRRETEIQWMNVVEDEFRKQRVREKCEVRRKLRIHNLEKNTSIDFKCNAPNCCAHGLNAEECTNQSNKNMDLNSNILAITSNTDTVPDSHLEKCEVQENGKIKNNSQIRENISRDIDAILCAVEDIDKKMQCLSMVNDLSQNVSQGVEKSFVSDSELNTAVLRNGSGEQEAPKQVLHNGEQIAKNEQTANLEFLQKKQHNSRNVQSDKKVSETHNGGTGSTDRDNLNGYMETTYSTEVASRNTVDGPIMAQMSVGIYNAGQETCISQKTQKTSTALSAIALSNERHLGKLELDLPQRNQHDYASSFEDRDAETMNDRSNGLTKQPTGMKKWLRRQNRDHNQQETMARPEPEGARSSSDDCKHMDGRRDRLNVRTRPVGANSQSNANYRCSHGSGFHCGTCNHYGNYASGFSRDAGQIYSTPISPPLGISRRSERARDERKESHPRTQILSENGTSGNLPDFTLQPELPGNSVEEYELHTRLCRTSSGRTFESHSYFALERRKEDRVDNDATRNSNPAGNPKANFFSSPNFQNELKESIRRKSRDFDKRSRKYPTGDYDSDESGSDRRGSRYQRQHTRGQKKKALSDHRESSFSRNHPHRNGARMKPQANGHAVNGRSSSAPKSSHASVPQERMYNSELE